MSVCVCISVCLFVCLCVVWLCLCWCLFACLSLRMVARLRLVCVCGGSDQSRGCGKAAPKSEGARVWPEFVPHRLWSHVSFLQLAKRHAFWLRASLSDLLVRLDAGLLWSRPSIRPTGVYAVAMERGAVGDQPKLRVVPSRPSHLQGREKSKSERLRVCVSVCLWVSVSFCVCVSACLVAYVSVCLCVGRCCVRSSGGLRTGARGAHSWRSQCGSRRSHSRRDGVAVHVVPQEDSAAGVRATAARFPLQC